MQTDMHYYGTYAMARAAGITPAVCKTIAFAAQFVDDNAAQRHIEFDDGGRVDAQATAHHVSDILKNLEKKDQRQVWLPFHFLPGNEGDSFTERLICRKNSDIAKDMVSNHVGFASRDFGAHLIGIAAHVYADTFAHHGFSGVSSRFNKVDNKSIGFNTALDPDIEDYIKGKAADFFRRNGINGGLFANIKSWLAETVSGALGHGAVATYPDRPYLEWEFEYEHTKARVVRNNPQDFLEGCKALHTMFVNYGKKNQDHSDGDGVAFGTIEKTVKGIIKVQGAKKIRVKQWKKAAKDGELSGSKFSIPDYKEETWLKDATKKMNSAKNSESALDSDLYRFYQAASLHRQFVLRELLPDYQLVVA